MKIDTEWLPKYTEFWVVFDCSNGNSRSHRYCWWFDTRRAAREHIKHTKTLKYAADLSQPVKVRMEI